MKSMRDAPDFARSSMLSSKGRNLFWMHAPDPPRAGCFNSIGRCAIRQCQICDSQSLQMALLKNAMINRGCALTCDWDGFL